MNSHASSYYGYRFPPESISDAVWRYHRFGALVRGTVDFYDAAGARGATVVVPPTSTANVSRHGPRSSARDRTIAAVTKVGRRRRMTELGRPASYRIGL